LKIHRLTKSIDPSLAFLSENNGDYWQTVSSDWYQEAITHPPKFALLIDSEQLTFTVKHSTKTFDHPEAEEKTFLPELWKYDVSELFLADPSSGHYVELNLNSCGSWWSCEFIGIRKPKHIPDSAPEGIYTERLKKNSLLYSSVNIPLKYLRTDVEIDIENATGNVSFITNSPNQRFLTYSDLPGKEPDFHQPNFFSNIKIIDLS